MKIAILAVSATVAVAAAAQVPPDIESQLVRIGKIVDPACTAKLYRPAMPSNDIVSGVEPLYPGITVSRNVSFGSDPKDVVDIFAADQGPQSRPVLIYVPGGGGEKIELQTREANAFYDNIARWATRHGMVGVLMQRHRSSSWDGGAKDVSTMIQFLQTKIADYHGNPQRMFIWAHSAGNVPLGTYLGHPELWGPKGVGLRGAILMSAAPFDIYPLAAEMGTPDDMMRMFALAGKTCGAGGPMSTDAPLPGKSAGEPGGPANAPAGGGPPSAAAVDAATLAARSSLPALRRSSVALLLANGELDVGADPTNRDLMPFTRILHDELCKAGPNHCPTLLVPKGHSHMSIVFSIDTNDTSVSDPVLAWIRKTK